VDRVLAERPEFRQISCEEILAAQRINLPSSWRAFTDRGELMLWPHRTATDGFYAAAFERTV